MGQDMKYVIDSKVYENHINDEVHLYGLLHQLAFLAEKAKDEKDLENLAETSKRYGEIAEEKFDDWLIPGRYLVFGDRIDLAELKAAELTPLTAVLKEHDARIREKQRAALNCTPFVRQYDILSNRWGDLLCQEEHQTNDTRRNLRSW